ncbi:MAG: O-antigen ligase family protein, partial [Herbiconiux sp.]|nr:O-antigen ligase family protein [Herbiconiux sp.]
MRYPTDAATRSLAVLVLFTLFAGQFWRNLLGWGGFAAVTLTLTVTLAVLMTRRGLWTRLSLRRLPRTLLLFGLLAVLSIAWSFYPGATALGL